MSQAIEFNRESDNQKEQGLGLPQKLMRSYNSLVEAKVHNLNLTTPPVYPPKSIKPDMIATRAGLVRAALSQFFDDLETYDNGHYLRLDYCDGQIRECEESTIRAELRKTGEFLLLTDITFSETGEVSVRCAHNPDDVKPETMSFTTDRRAAEFFFKKFTNLLEERGCTSSIEPGATNVAEENDLRL